VLTTATSAHALPSANGRYVDGSEEEVRIMHARDWTVYLLAGLAGGLVASFAMERFQRLLGVVSPDVGGAPGGGGQQYRKPQSEPATYVAADALAQAVTGQRLPPPLQPTAGSLVHYAFGGSVGLLYGALTARTRGLLTGRRSEASPTRSTASRAASPRYASATCSPEPTRVPHAAPEATAFERTARPRQLSQVPHHSTVSPSASSRTRVRQSAVWA
jgi:hypothetical protein